MRLSIFPVFADVFKKGIWAELDEIQDPELRELGSFLPGVVIRSRAPATVEKYAGAFCRWKKWAATREEVQSFPARPIHVALYLSFLIQKSVTAAPVEEALNALSWAHRVGCVEDPTRHPLLRQVMDGAKRMLAHKVEKKEPITPEMLHSLVEKFGKDDAPLTDIRTLAMCLCGFAGFLRYNELAGLTEADAKFFSEHLELFIESSKTDQYRDGAVLVIARTGTACCPVAMLERYMIMAGMNIANPSSKHLFRGLISTNNGQRLRDAGGLSYTRARELVLGMLVSIGLDPKKFSLHSLRSGGASAAANAGVPDRWFKRHGRWCSESAKDGYVQDSFKDRLSVSKSLGL